VHKRIIIVDASYFIQKHDSVHFKQIDLYRGNITASRGVFLCQDYIKEMIVRWIRVVVLLLIFASESMFMGREVAAQQALFALAPGSPITVGGYPGNVMFSDVNNDGKLDLLAASSKEPRITVLVGQGNGQFSAAQTKPILLPDPPSDMAVGDINSDNTPDLAISSHDSYGVMLLLGDGQGSFVLAPNSPVVMKTGHHAHTHGMQLGDVNHDGNLDILTANSEDNDISVVLGNGKGDFVPASGSPFAVGRSPYPLTLGDVNHDGNLDIVSTSTAEFNPALTLLLGNGKAEFQRIHLATRTVRPWFVAIGDVNGDVNPDIVVTHAERLELTVLSGDGTGNFTEIDGSPFNLEHSAWHIALVDVNADGNIDVVAAADEGVVVMLNKGQGDFTPAPGSPFLTAKGSWRLSVGDVNGDSKPDIATSNLENDSVSILLGQ
jgi:hypothetical protein